MEELFESVADPRVLECDGGIEEDVWVESGDIGDVDG